MKTPAALSIAATILLTLACAGEDPAGDPPAPSPDPPTLEEIGNATIHIDGDTVQLQDGAYERKAPAGDGQAGLTEQREVRLQDVLLSGDLDEDGTPEALVFATDWTGGTGTYWSLIVMDRRDEGVVQSAAASIGDRVQVRDARIDGRRVELDVVRAGDGDGLCCPGEMATMAWVFDNDTLRAVDSGVEPVRRSLAALAGAEWVLTHFGDEAVPADGARSELVFTLGLSRPPRPH